MPRAHLIKTNFTSGELSPLMEGRVDIPQYSNGAQVLKNVVIMPQGGVDRRGGWHFVDYTKDHDKKCRLIPFEYTTIQAYILEFGDGYIRFYMNGFQIQKDDEPYEIESPYTEEDLSDLQFRQTFDTLKITHPKYMPMNVTREDHDDWSINPMEPIDGPYFDEETTPTITPSGTSGNITLTASGSLFDENHIGCLWGIKHGETWGYVQITGYTSPTVVGATVKKTLGGTSASAAHREGAWSDVSGYPRTLTFFEDRCIYAGTPTQPQTFWGSKCGAYNDFTPGIEDDDPFAYTIGSGVNDIIMWMTSGKVVIIGTAGGEYSVKGGGDNPITPSSVMVALEQTKGSAPIMPLRIGHVTLFIQRAGRQLIELAYNWEEDGYFAPDLSILAEHLVFYGIRELAYQQQPNSVVWVVRSDGMLLGMNYERSQNIVGWHQHHTDGEVESIAVIPNSYYYQDELWAVIKRNIDGEDKRYVERMDAYAYTDSCLAYSGEPIDEVSGLDHLIGKDVEIIGDGAVYPPQVVDETGSVKLDGPPASEIEVGLWFESEAVLLRPEVKPAEGMTSQWVHKHWSRLVVRLFESVGVTINDELVEFRTSDDRMDEGVSVFSGDKSVSNLGRSRDARVTIKQTQPLPFTLICVIGTLDMGD